MPRLARRHSLGWAVSVLAVTAAPLALAQTPAAINHVPPTPQGRAIYVTDLGDLLTPEDEALLQQRLAALDDAGIAQIAILTLPNTDRDLSSFAPEIANAWGVGHRDKDDGVLLLANAERIRRQLSGNRIFLSTGLAVEAQIPDAVAGRILDEQALPAFEAGAYSQGIRNSALTVAQILQGDRKLQRHYREASRDVTPGDVLFLLLILGLMLLSWRMGGPFIFLGGGGFGGGGGGWGDGSGGGGFGGGRSGGGGAGR